MTGTLRMPPKKKDEAKAAEQQAQSVDAQAGKTEFSEQVKLRAEFKMDLQTVAQRMKMPMGELVERLMFQFIESMMELHRKGKPLLPLAPPPRPGTEDEGQ